MDKVQEYSDYIEGLAYKDALTGLSNKAAYDAKTEELQGDIQGGNAEFAIVMVDLNYLKKINDTYGHEIGNDYINRLCHKIISVFPEQDIYRIGDEFVVVVYGKMYHEREERIKSLRESMRNQHENPDKPWKNVSAAVGVAVYDPNFDSSVKTVFERADEDMYANKVAMKAQRE